MPEEWMSARPHVKEMRDTVLAEADGLPLARAVARRTAAEQYHQSAKDEFGPMSQESADATVTVGAWDDVCWFIANTGAETFSLKDWNQDSPGQKITGWLADGFSRIMNRRRST